MTPSTVRAGLFLDRDGVINVDKHYVYRIEDFEFVPGIFELCATGLALGYRLVVVTNQAGIGRGYYTEDDFQTLTTWMLERLSDRGIDVARVYHCPFHPTGGLGPYRRESFDRKPHPGMLFKARDDLGLDLGRSVLVGDKASDMAAGRAAGLRRLFRLDHPAPTNEEQGSPDETPRSDETVVHDLVDAAERLRGLGAPVD